MSERPSVEEVRKGLQEQLDWALSDNEAALAEVFQAALHYLTDYKRILEQRPASSEVEKEAAWLESQQRRSWWLQDIERFNGIAALLRSQDAEIAGLKSAAAELEAEASELRRLSKVLDDVFEMAAQARDEEPIVQDMSISTPGSRHVRMLLEQRAGYLRDLYRAESEIAELKARLKDETANNKK